tara:strand:+ start:207 stop:959 length:753 start_codon:yes stop_codon:yes gene_type:complete
MNLNDLRTPRPMPDDIEEWSPEIEELLAEWAEVALCYQYLHNYSTRKYKRKYHHYQIPIIVLSTLTGTANFAADSYVPEDLQQGFSACVGSLNIAAGIMGTLLAFLKYAEIYEGHRISALAWSKLSRNIEIELSLHDLKRKPCKEFLKVMRSEYDNLLESSPNIDLDIVNMFNKKFNDKYPNVRKPVICNGLREIKPFYNDNPNQNKPSQEPSSKPDPTPKDKSPEPSSEPPLSVEPEPEPEPEVFDSVP